MLETPTGAAGRLRAGFRPSSLGVVLLGVALPLAFLHERWQRIGSLGPADVNVSDLAIGVLALVCLVVVAREGSARLRPLRLLAIASLALAAWIVVSMVVERARGEGYAFGSAATSAATFFAYAVFAVAPPLLLRTASDRRLLLAVVTGWGVVAVAVGVLQFLGLDILGAWPPGRRQPSVLGTHDFAALGAVLAGLAVGLAARRDRGGRLGLLLALLGTLGLALSGAVAGIAGLLLGLALALLAARGRALPARSLVLSALVLVVAGLGVLSLRGGDIVDFASFLGKDEAPAAQADRVESYSQRTVLVYLGLRMFEDRPLTGVGWMRSNAPSAHAPFLADARERFDVAEEGLPTEEHPYGIQNAYVQALADLGLPGLLLFCAWLGASFLLAWRAARGGAPVEGRASLVVLGVGAGLWAAEGIVPGVPLAAATWLAAGLAAAGLVRAAAAEDD